MDKEQVLSSIAAFNPEVRTQINKCAASHLRIYYANALLPSFLLSPILSGLVN